MPPTFESLIAGFLLLLVVFRVIEWWRAPPLRLPIRRRGFFTDLAYWLVTPWVSGVAAKVAVAVSLVPFVLVIHGRMDHETIMRGFGPAARLPLGVQLVAILVLGDFIGYWTHRAFHGARLWPYHAVHHSSQDLDWLSSVRLHPLNEIGARVVATLPLVLTGLAPAAVAGALPIITLFGVLLHANVDWDWGPLRGVIASPRFHRWHHALDADAEGRNFAGLLPLWDILFGTYYMPRERIPRAFGIAEPMPTSILGQLMYPFRRS